jgi:hypothetical protein
MMPDTTGLFRIALRSVFLEVGMSRLAVLGVILGVGAVGACGGDVERIVVLPPPVTLSIVAGNGQSANVRHLLSNPLTIVANTPDGGVVPGVSVDWTVTSGGGTVSASSVITDAQGRASVVWTLGGVAGDQIVTATGPAIVGSPTKFSATAGAPIVLHYDGTSWTTALVDVNGALISFTSIWGATGSAVFAAGMSCAGPFPMKSEGSQWAQLPASCPGNDPNQLTSVWGSSPVDLFATQRIGLRPHEGGAVVHYDGQNWSNVYTPPSSAGILCPSPQAVWSSSSTDVFAVGDGGMIVHYDGTGWTPLQSGTTQPLAGVWGAGAGSAVFAVGAGGTILNYDGTTWRAQASGTTQSLNAVWGTSANDVFAVGSSGTILHYDGTSWTPQVSGSTQALNGVWGSSGTSVFAVGNASTILHFDGTTWTAQTTAADMNLRGVWGSSTTGVFAVGVPR